jgi:hypothetical protein
MNQWQNTYEVIDWYKSIDNKINSSFICFDICEFYPSITEDLLNKALMFASTHTAITDEERLIIAQAKKSIVFSNCTPWYKKVNSKFDVTMGSFDGAETCELIGLYLLSQLQNLDINIGLYRDDGLAICNKSPKEIENIKKDICKVFRNNNLNVTIEANQKVVDFLDITLDLNTGIYKPFMKPNNVPLYVNRKSNHPPSIIKNIPESINRRLSKISANENSFKEAAPVYQKALEHSGYKYKLRYNPPEDANSTTNNAKRKRKRQITWFNPPFGTNVVTNVGKKFLALIDRCFPPGHKLYQIFNRNTVKISYSCMQNMQQVITKQNKSIIRKANPQDIPPNECNCRKGKQCPLDGKCLTEGIIYQAKITRLDNSKVESYIGLTDNSFKTRFNGHTSSFRNEPKRNSTALSHYVWKLKDNNTPYEIKWKLITRAQSYSTTSKLCNLCLKEKYFIICKPDMATLNNRNELASECRHKKRHLLSNYNPP